MCVCEGGREGGRRRRGRGRERERKRERDSMEPLNIWGSRNFAHCRGCPPLWRDCNCMCDANWYSQLVSFHISISAKIGILNQSVFHISISAKV